MKANRSRRFVQFAIAAACLIATIGECAATTSRACATRDLQILMMIEARQDIDPVSAQTLTDALQTMTHARMVCHEGKVADAIEIYDTIARTLVADSGALGRIR